MIVEMNSNEKSIIESKEIKIIYEKVKLKLFSSILTAEIFKKNWTNELETMFKDCQLRLSTYFDDVIISNPLIDFSIQLKRFCVDYKNKCEDYKRNKSNFKQEIVEKIFDTQNNKSLSIKEAYEEYIRLNNSHKISLSAFYSNVKKLFKYRYATNPIFNNKAFSNKNNIAKKMYVIRLLDSICCNNYMIFIDEANFSMKKLRIKRWMNENSNKMIKNEGRTPGVSVIAALSKDGLLNIDFNYGCYNQDNMILFFKSLISEILKIEVLKDKYYSFKLNIVMDNASIHTGKKIRLFLSETMFKITYLPPYCPWYNGVEFFWSLIRRNMNRNLVLKG